ncbi:hypothetical protein A1Q2_03869 [Trichosporon asahii var. asahii CBS 8904]|uniref:Uncharacterized protein n=1 Tax=Trichosporon asahii var. asahii (strain CBS 8904) TaxID=1220162 RepID=K1VM52_TRIAC|nr:hypothetical protein A1Q2_03869 [Trichosporon asahii var. asahii CBS 8904]
MGSLRLDALEKQASQRLGLELAEAIEFRRLLLEQSFLLGRDDEVLPDSEPVGRLNVVKIFLYKRDPSLPCFLRREGNSLAVENSLEEVAVRRWILPQDRVRTSLARDSPTQ